MTKPKLIFPCKIDWESMPQHGTAKYCSECKKAINDYTSSKLNEVASPVFCGRFTSDQLSYHRSEYEIRNFRTLSLSILTLLGAIAPDQDLVAQTDSVHKESSDAIKKENFQAKFSNLRFPLRMEGTIRDKTSKEVIVNADVRLIQKDSVIYSVKTDAAGRFFFVLLEKDIRDSVFDLRVSYAGTDKPYRADSLLKVPFITDTIKRDAVFSIDFLLKPVVALQVSVPSIYTINPVAIGGAIAYTWSPPIDLNRLNIITGTYTVASPHPITEAYTVSPLQITPVTEIVGAKLLQESPSPTVKEKTKTSEEKKKESKLETSLSNRIWLALAGFVMFLFFGTWKLRK